jgi:mannose-6-phosphate isomerase-like protein (cupin superfamily)
MKRTLGVLAFLAALTVAFVAEQTCAQKKIVKKEPIIWAAENLKWVEMKDGPPGVMVATLWGDWSKNKGSWGVLVKLPAGFDTPLHFHTNDFKAVVISGTFLHVRDGKEESLGAGSYLSIPGGDRHITRVSKDAPCTLFQEGSGMWDLKPVAEKK